MLEPTYRAPWWALGKLLPRPIGINVHRLKLDPASPSFITEKLKYKPIILDILYKITNNGCTSVQPGPYTSAQSYRCPLGFFCHRELFYFGKMRFNAGQDYVPFQNFLMRTIEKNPPAKWFFDGSEFRTAYMTDMECVELGEQSANGVCALPSEGMVQRFQYPECFHFLSQLFCRLTFNLFATLDCFRYSKNTFSYVGVTLRSFCPYHHAFQCWIHQRSSLLTNNSCYINKKG